MDIYNLIYENDESDEEDDTDNFLIHNRNTISTNCLDEMIEHSFIDSIDLNTYHKTKKPIYILVYRLNCINENYFTEFYLNKGEFLSISYSSDLHFIATNINIVGTSYVKGSIDWNGNQYLIIKQKNNNIVNNNWTTLFDIVVNGCVFGEKIQENVISFFKTHHTIANLIQNNTILMKPIVLYSMVNEIHRLYIQRTKSIQYCQTHNNCLITLHNGYMDTDNIRNICFVDECDITDDIDLLNIEKYILLRAPNNMKYWIFKDDKYILSITEDS